MEIMLIVKYGKKYVALWTSDIPSAKHGIAVYMSLKVRNREAS